jgi:hypothetical protein
MLSEIKTNHKAPQQYSHSPKHNDIHYTNSTILNASSLAFFHCYSHYGYTSQHGTVPAGVGTPREITVCMPLKGGKNLSVAETCNFNRYDNPATYLQHSLFLGTVLQKALQN